MVQGQITLASLSVNNLSRSCFVSYFCNHQSGNDIIVKYLMELTCKSLGHIFPPTHTKLAAIKKNQKPLTVPHRWRSG